MAKSSSGATRGGSRLTTEALLFELANLHDDGIGRFRRKWGKVYGKYSQEKLLRRRDELRLLWTSCHSRLEKATERTFALAVSPEITERTRKLYSWWEHSGGRRLEQLVCQHWLESERTGWQVVWTNTEKRIKANPGSLPAVLAWACIFHANHLGICRNERCGARFFLARRKDQLYCCSDCAWPAKKAAKLRWWTQNRGKKAKVRSPKRGGRTRWHS